MTDQEIKEEFLTSLTIDQSLISPLYLSILDEAIETIVKGNTKINGKTPSTQEERIYCIGLHFTTAQKVLNETMQAVKEQSLNLPVTLTYRGQTYQY
ncbi:MAG TPA: hypothetical protein VK766_11020 [Cytophagaceae bacterium]|jgi:hypothetical protein|nr:hypothetical protein [Cytophagaceae bacterium]